MRLTGFEAIEYAEKEGLTLHKSADNIDAGAVGLSVAEAEAIADGDAELIWLDVPAEEYYGEPQNMEPGTEPVQRPRMAGQRPDELLPGQNSGQRSRDVGAAGTPGGGLAAGGLAGTNAPDGEPDDDLEKAMAWGGRGSRRGRAANWRAARGPIGWRRWRHSRRETSKAEVRC